MGRLRNRCVCGVGREPPVGRWPVPSVKAFRGIASWAPGGKLLIREPYSSLQRKLLESEGVPVLESRVRIKDAFVDTAAEQPQMRKSEKTFCSTFRWSFP